MFWVCVLDISTSKFIKNVTNGVDFDILSWPCCIDENYSMPSDGHRTMKSHQRADEIIIVDDDNEPQAEIPVKRTPYCKRCRLHGRTALSRDHKRYCPFQVCECLICRKLLTEHKEMAQKVADRRALDQDRRTGLKPMYYDFQSRRLIFSTKVNDDVHETSKNTLKYKSYGKRKPNCKRCRLHNETTSLRDHKRYCPFQWCACTKCQNLLSEQKETADKVAVRRGIEQDRRTGLKPIYDDSIRLGFVTNHRKMEIPKLDGKYTIVKPLFLSPIMLDTTHGSVNASEHHRRIQALKQMLESFHSQGVDGTLICSYIILKECDFVVDKAFEKILDARNDIGSYTGRDPSNLVAPSSNNYWSTVVPQGATSPSTTLLYPQLNCLPSYYGYPFPSSAAAAASGNAAAAAAAAAAASQAAGANAGGHPLLNAAPISLCSYVPTGVVQHPSSAGSLNSVASSMGPGPPPPMMEITTSGDSRGSDCRGDESDRESGPTGPERSVSVDRGVGSNDDVQSDRKPPGPSTEEAATSPSSASALVLRSSFQPSTLSFALHSTYKNRTQSIES